MAAGQGKHWVAAPPPGHWEDEDGNPTSAPADPKPVADNKVVSVPDAPVDNTTGAWNQARAQTSNNPSMGGVGGVGPTANPAAPAAPAPAPVVADTVARAKQLADEAMARDTNPGTITASTAGATTVDRTGTTQPVVTPEFAGRTSAPNPVQVDRLGNVVVANAPAITADKVASPEISQSGAALQFDAARTYQDILGGKDSLADKQLRDAQDRAAAEQLSIAAGARGQGVVSARRNAATNIGLQQQQNAGQYAELRAKELADAAAGLGTIGTSVQGQNLTAAAQLTETEKANQLANLDASKNTASNTIEVGKANAANAADVGKANLTADVTVKTTNAANQLKADLSSDDRLQGLLSQAADLKQKAAAGDQSAATQLDGLQAQLSTELAKFNATQLQTADSTNIENKLRSMGLDDQYVEATTALWVQAENNKDQVALDKLKIQIQQQAINAQKQGNGFNFISSLLGGFAKMIPIVGPVIGGLIDSAGKSSGPAYDTDVDGNAVDANGDPIVMSDRRLKESITVVRPADVDAFLKAQGKTQTWEYKPGKGLPEGRKLGPMAQDMKANKLASMAVGQDDDGMMSLDYQALAALALAGLGRLNQRVEAVEAKSTPKGKGKPKADVAGFMAAQRKGKR